MSHLHWHRGFGEKIFDVAVCANLLHHMDSHSDLEKLFRNMKRVAKKILIVEIQDPMEENFFGRLRHQYYLKFLKDEATGFFSKDSFEKLLNNNFEPDTVKFEYLPTIRGVYMMGEIENL